MAIFLQNTNFQDLVLPCVALFVLFFAILEKTELLGKGKTQINAILSFVISVIFVTGFAVYVTQVKQFFAFFAVSAVILFVLMLLYSFAYNNKDDALAGLPWIKPLVGTIIFIAVVVAVLVITGYWSKVYDYVVSGDSESSSIIFIVIIGLAIYFVLRKPKTGNEEKPAKKE